MTLSVNPLQAPIQSAPALNPQRPADPAPPVQTARQVAPAPADQLITAGKAKAVTSLSLDLMSSPAPADISLSGFLTGFQAGNALELDGTAWYNGTGTIKLLDADHLKLTTAGKIGDGDISVSRIKGNQFAVKVVSDGETDTYTMNAVRSGDTVTLTDVDDPEQKFVITRYDGYFSIDTPGIGSVDIKHQ